MKYVILFVLSLSLFAGCARGQSSKFATVPQPKAGEKVATFGGGCFWSMSEAFSELRGVNRVISGYSGGSTPNPTYEQVGTGETGHAEVVQVYYDPAVISFPTLAQAFFSAHDPTELNRQGPDEGTDYRSIAFYRTPEERSVLLDEIRRINASRRFPRPIVTQVVAFRAFYPAEEYHQGYFRLHPESPYIVAVSTPKVMHFRQAMHAQLKPGF